MNGQLTVHYFEGKKLQMQVYKDLNPGQASAIIAKVMQECPQVQFTWIREEDNNG